MSSDFCDRSNRRRLTIFPRETRIFVAVLENLEPLVRCACNVINAVSHESKSLITTHFGNRACVRQKSSARIQIRRNDDEIVVTISKSVNIIVVVGVVVVGGGGRFVTVRFTRDSDLSCSD